MEVAPLMYSTKKSDREGTTHLVQSTEPSAMFVMPITEHVLCVHDVHYTGTCSLNAQLYPLPAPISSAVRSWRPPCADFFCRKFLVPAPISSAVRFYSEGSDATKWGQILSFIEVRTGASSRSGTGGRFPGSSLRLRRPGHGGHPCRRGWCRGTRLRGRGCR